MAIYDLLPTFNYIEPNNLKGLQAGLVVAQVDNVAAGLLKQGKFLENGKICGMSVVGSKVEIHAFTSADKTMFIHYSEPLNTVVNEDKFFAVNVKNECPRLVQLMPGDEWMSTEELTLEGALAGRIVEVTKTTGIGKADDWYSCETMANGDAGYHYVYLG